MNKIDGFSNYTQNHGLDFDKVMLSENHLNQMDSENKLDEHDVDQAAVKYMSASIIDTVLPNIPKELLAKLNLADLQEAFAEFLKNDPKLSKDLSSMKEVLIKLIDEIKQQNPKDIKDLKTLQDALIQLQENVMNNKKLNTNETGIKNHEDKNNKYVFDENAENNLKLYDLAKDHLIQHLLTYPDSKNILELSKHLLASTWSNKTNLKSDTPKEEQNDSNSQDFNINNAGGMTLSWGNISNTRDIMLLITMLFIAMADIPTNQAFEMGKILSRKKDLADKLNGGKTILDDISDILPLSDEMYTLLFGPGDKVVKSLADVLKAIHDKCKEADPSDELKALNAKVDTFVNDFNKNSETKINLDIVDPVPTILTTITNYFDNINQEYLNVNPDVSKKNLIDLDESLKNVTSSDSTITKDLKRCSDDVSTAISDSNSVSSQMQIKLNSFLTVMQGYLDGASKNVQSYGTLMQAIYR